MVACKCKLQMLACKCKLHMQAADASCKCLLANACLQMQAANTSIYHHNTELHHIESREETPVLISGPAGTVLVEEKPVKTIPDRAGIVQAAKLLKQRDIVFGWDGAVMSTKKYMKKIIEDEDFKSGASVSANEYVNANGGIVSGCLGDIENFLKNKKLEQVVAIIKSCTPNALGDFIVNVKDLSVPGNGSGVGGSGMLMEEKEIVKLII
nr:hypothetical protein [Tanacetum cinerariifolium]